MIDEFIEILNDEIDGKIRAATLGFSQTGRLVLGGEVGPDGGSGTPPGGFIGKLNQNYVTYDTTEALASGGVSSLVDNLNHIRYNTGINVEDIAVVSGFVQQNIINIALNTEDIALNGIDIAQNAADIAVISGELDGFILPAASVEIDEIGTATYDDIQDWLNNTNSSMYVEGCEITENANLDGTIDISAGKGYIKTGNTDISLLKAFDISAINAVAIASGINYIYVDYNGGFPVYADQVVPPNHYTEIVIGQVYKDNENHPHMLQGGQNFNNFPDRVLRMLVGVFGMQRQSGLEASEAVMERALNVTAGISWQGTNKFVAAAYNSDVVSIITGGGSGGTISANNTIVLDSEEGDKTGELKHGLNIRIMDSSNGNDGAYIVQSFSYSAPNTTIIIEESTLNTGNDTGHIHLDTFVYWYYDGIGESWVEVDGNIQIDNTYYDDTSLVGLTELTANRYGVHWVFSDYDGHIHVLYGQGNYTITQAENAALPATIPDMLSEFSVIIAKVIIKKNATAFTSIVSAWITPFATTSVDDHNDLAGLQGGTADEYYHLNVSDHIELSAWLPNIILGSSGEITLPAENLDVTTSGEIANLNANYLQGYTAEELLGGDSIIAGDGLVKVGNTISVYVDDVSIKIVDDYLYVYAIDGGSF